MREGCPARPGAQGDSPEPPRLARRRAWDLRPGERRRQGEGPRRQRWPRAPLKPRGPSQGALARGSRRPGDRRPWPGPLLTRDLRGLGSVLLRRRPRQPSLTPSIHSGRLTTWPAQRAPGTGDGEAYDAGGGTKARLRPSRGLRSPWRDVGLYFPAQSSFPAVCNVPFYRKYTL